MVESFTIFAGERYDFILHANQPIRNYWIRARGLAECGPQYKSVSQTAFLTYENAAVVLPSESPDYQSGNRPGTVNNIMPDIILNSSTLMCGILDTTLCDKVSVTFGRS
jgi:hypothetical protein